MARPTASVSLHGSSGPMRSTKIMLGAKPKSEQIRLHQAHRREGLKEPRWDEAEVV